MIYLQFLVIFILIIVLFYIRKRVSWKRLQRYESKISGHIDVSEKYNGERVLMTNYFVQGVSIEQPSIRKSYWYRIASETIKRAKGKRNYTVLFIGLGANTSSLLIHRENPNIRQVIVEIDPLIVRACREYFSLDELKNAEIIEADIFALLPKKKTGWKGNFDAIVIDTFDANPPYLLKGSHDPKVLNQLLAWLKADGMFLFNIPVKTTGKDIPSLQVYLSSVFRRQTHEIIHDPRGYRNHVLIAIKKK